MIDEHEQYLRMTTLPVPKLIGSLAAPSIFSMLITSIYNMTDTYFVSQLGTSASAAVGIVFALMALIQSVGFTLAMGCSSYVSRFLGKEDLKSASKYASVALFTAISAGLMLTVFGNIFLYPLMRLLGSTETVLPYAASYGRYILFGAPVMCSTFVLNNVLRAQGFTKYTMVSNTVGGVTNMILDPIFIFLFDLGISGAAIATLIGQVASFSITLFYFVSGKSFVKISLSKIDKHFGILLKIVGNGSPTLCRQGLSSVASALLAICARPYGDAAIAAMTLSTKIYMFVRSIVIGLGQSFQPVAGYNYGAGKYSRVKKAFYFTLIVSTVFGILLSVLFYFEAGTVIQLFRKDDSEVIRIGTSALKYLCIVMPLLGFSSYVNMILQCLGRSKSAAFLASCRQGVFYIPTILLISTFFGLKGLVVTQPIADFLTAVMSVFFYINFFKSKNGLGREDLPNKTYMN